MRGWASRSFAAPAPQLVKWAVLERYSRPGDIWVETGTFMGETTDFLSRIGSLVYSIEPSPELSEAAMLRFARTPKVTIIKGLSEECLPELIQTLGGSVSFWLDGHFSEGVTFQGPTDTPIVMELAAIQANLHRFDRATILVDDVRCFDPLIAGFESYPDRSKLVDWAISNSLGWTIEHDIFVAWKH